MKLLLGLVLCSLMSMALGQGRASAFIRDKPVRKIFERYHPKGLLPFTDFTYDLKTTEDKKIELHCPYISLHQPCAEYVFKITDGAHVETVCGRQKKYHYTSKTNMISIHVVTGKKLLKVHPRCSARPVS